MHHQREVIFTRRSRYDIVIKYYKKKNIVFMDELFTIYGRIIHSMLTIILFEEKE